MSAEDKTKTIPEPAELPSPMARVWREWIKPFLIILLVVGSFRSAFADWNDVPTGSMVPTILEGDRIFVNKLAYSLRLPFTTVHLVEWDGPERGDIVVFFSPDEQKRLVKRVVGLPGDKISVHRNRLIINGEVARYQQMDLEDLDEAARDRHPQGRYFEELLGVLDHPVAFSPYHPMDRNARNFAPLTIPDGQYFVMGDNRDNSRDSRIFGTVERDQIVGRAAAIAFSLDRKEGYKPRWNRSFQRLE